MKVNKIIPIILCMVFILNNINTDNELDDFRLSKSKRFAYIHETISNQNLIELYRFNSNTPYSIIYLNSNHFSKGTVRITVPGNYILTENIIFDPNPENDCQPTFEQIRSGIYKVTSGNPYHLGFFAAITIETDNVILDLNGFKIEQSPLHNLQQRFYSCIELASSPFIVDQGPAKLTTDENFSSANYCRIMNGTLGKSSHHGIHGNGMTNIIIENLTIKDFEVAAIALNGSINCIIRNINITNCSTNIPILSTYSQCRFIKPFLKKLKKEKPHSFLTINKKNICIDKIISDIDNCLSITKNCIINNIGNIEPIFINKNKLYDGNMYGIVLNTNGVVVNDFITERTNESIGNERVYLKNINIQNIITEPIEILACKESKLNDKPFTYGKGLISGPVGDIIDLMEIIGFDSYHENELTNAQLIILKYKKEEKTNKVSENTNTERILRIVETNYRKQHCLRDIKRDLMDSLVTGGDSMGHRMKGNIGCFISAGKDITINNMNINNVSCKGTGVGNNPIIPPEYINKQGSNAYGILVCGSDNIKMNNLKINNITSENGISKKIEILDSRKN